jgi:hypothetical protein
LCGWLATARQVPLIDTRPAHLRPSGHACSYCLGPRRIIILAIPLIVPPPSSSSSLTGVRWAASSTRSMLLGLEPKHSCLSQLTMDLPISPGASDTCLACISIPQDCLRLMHFRHFSYVLFHRDTCSAITDSLTHARSRMRLHTRTRSHTCAHTRARTASLARRLGHRVRTLVLGRGRHREGVGGRRARARRGR